jgi:hypothetical protein
MSEQTLLRPIPPSQLQLVLDVKSPVARGESVTLTLALHNRSEQDEAVLLGYTSQEFDFSVGLPGGRQIWSRLYREVLTGMLRRWKLRPGGVLVFTHHWDQRDNGGAPIAPGEYHVYGQLLGESDAWQAGPRRLLVIE